MTKSEQLFESFCTNNGIPFVRLIPDGQKTPDYEIELGEIKTIAEIKELTMNDEEKRVLRYFKKKSFSTWGSGKIGDRVRNKIESSKKQLERYASNKCPGMIVLYDARPIPFTGISPYEVKVAMYGFETIEIHTPKDFGAPLKFGKHKFGKGKKLRSDSHTYISAIGVLREINHEGELHLDIYHNIHAEIPIAVEAVLAHEKISIYTILPDKIDEFHEWAKIVPE